MKRNSTVDALKAYACFLVVFGHVIMGIRKGGIEPPAFFLWLENFIWTFHVPLFMFLSGYVYKLTGEWRKKGRVGLIRHKALNLLIPYSVFSAFYIVINSFVPGTNQDFSLRDILFLWRTPIAQYWFIYTLFLLFLTWSAASTFLKNWQITLLLALISLVLQFCNLVIPVFSDLVNYSFAFGLGTCISELPFEKKPLWQKGTMVTGHILIAGSAVYYQCNGLPIFSWLIQLLGICASIALISEAIRCEFLKKSLLGLNRYSFPIYLLHTIFTAGFRIVLRKLGIDSYALHVILGTAAGIIVPVVIGKIAEMSPYLDFFFFPSKNLRILQKKRSEIE